MKSKLFRQLTETKYLSADNAWRYRAIMRCFYLNDMKYRHWMNKEDVYEQLIVEEEFSLYTIDMCKQDLDGLTEWGNLSAVQDTSKVTSYQQFVSKQYRYQMTEYAIEIERMTIRLENLFFESGSLEPTLLERIKEEIKRIPSLIESDDKTIGGWWSQLTNDFQRLNQNYQDFIRDWNSVKADEMMKTKHFLLYKEKLVDYLRHFIQELQHHAYDIELVLNAFHQDELDTLFDKISDYELSIPRLDMEQVTHETLHEFIRDKYINIVHFFTSTVQRDSEVDNILSMTNEIIRKITRYAASILEMSSQYSSRKEEYMKIANLFSEFEDIEEAHLLSGQVFGISSYLHLLGDFQRETESSSSSIYDEKPMEVILSPRVRTYREKMIKSAIIDHQAEKLAMRAKVLKERAEEEDILMSYLVEKQVVFEQLTDVPEKVRRALLRWLVKGVQEKGKITVTEHGKRFRLLNPDENSRCLLNCEDGIMELPAYILVFEDN